MATTICRLKCQSEDLVFTWVAGCMGASLVQLWSRLVPTVTPTRFSSAPPHFLHGLSWHCNIVNTQLYGHLLRALPLGLLLHSG